MSADLQRREAMKPGGGGTKDGVTSEPALVSQLEDGRGKRRSHVRLKMCTDNLSTSMKKVGGAGCVGATVGTVAPSASQTGSDRVAIAGRQKQPRESSAIRGEEKRSVG